MHLLRLLLDAEARVSLGVPTVKVGPGSADLLTLRALGEVVSGGAVTALAGRRSPLRRAAAH